MTLRNAHFPIIFFVLFFFSCVAPDFQVRDRSTQPRSEYTVRVLLMETPETITLTSSNTIMISQKSNGRILHQSSGKNIKINYERTECSLTVTTENNILYLNEKPYRGKIEIIPKSGKISIINVIDLEDYLCSVVPGEIPSSWPMEALKAQAIAARTYTIYHMINSRFPDFDLDGTTNFQVYKGLAVENNKTDQAVFDTAGQILVSKNKPILTYFHSTCGGKTADDAHVWKGNDLPYLNEVTCHYCKNSPSYEWTTDLTLSEISNALNAKYRRIGKIRKISFHRESERITDVTIQHTQGTIHLTGNNFRMLFPQKVIKSLFFSCEKNGQKLILHGHGWGHGVGMCQYGAKGMAEEGKSYQEILDHYYIQTGMICIYDTHRSYLAGN